MITQKRLKDLLRYNPETGDFFWKVSRGSSGAGKKAGYSSGDAGYLQIGIDGKQYYAHRLAWLYMTGEWPEHEIDHRNFITSDNKFLNLRKATPTQNQVNKRKPKNNTSGVKGVHWDKRKKRWCSRVTVDGKSKHLGYFVEINDAVRVYNGAARKYYGEFV